ncbi:MAG: nitroreductase family protein [Bacteroidales bacterium]|nr:nitroreductase family protein [Bacteroidales bacterium]
MQNYIDQKLCKQCKLCIEVCPVNIIANGDKVHFLDEKIHICLKCGQCMAICSTKAIQIEGISYDKDLFDLPESTINHDEFINFTANRRSVRNFKIKPVEDELIKKILEAVQYAPNGSHPDKMNITVVNDRKLIESQLPAMSKFLDDIVKWMENPLMSRIIKLKKGIETFNTLKNHLYPIAKSGNYKLEFGDRISRGAPAIIIFHADKGAEEHSDNSLIWATYAMMAAQSLGLGATIVSLVPAVINKVKEVREAFKIPEEHETVVSVIVGYPKYKYKRGIKRTSHTIHF